MLSCFVAVPNTCCQFVTAEVVPLQQVTVLTCLLCHAFWLRLLQANALWDLVRRERKEEYGAVNNWCLVNKGSVLETVASMMC
jgi:hypothetical protein